MPEKGEELYKILKADPNYEGVGSDYNKFKTFFSDEKNYTNLYNTLKADPNYEGIGKDANSFSEYFELKKKEPTIPPLGQAFKLGGESTPQLPLTSQSRLGEKFDYSKNVDRANAISTDIGKINTDLAKHKKTIDFYQKDYLKNQGYNDLSTKGQALKTELDKFDIDGFNKNLEKTKNDLVEMENKVKDYDRLVNEKNQLPESVFENYQKDLVLYKNKVNDYNTIVNNPEYQKYFKGSNELHDIYSKQNDIAKNLKTNPEYQEALAKYNEGVIKIKSGINEFNKISTDLKSYHTLKAKENYDKGLAEIKKLNPANKVALYNNTLANINKRFNQNMLLAQQAKEQGDDATLQKLQPILDADVNKMKILEKGASAQKTIASLQEDNSLGNNLGIGMQMALGGLGTGLKGIDNAITTLQRDAFVAATGYDFTDDTKKKLDEFISKQNTSFPRGLSDEVYKISKPILEKANERSQIQDVSKKYNGSGFEALLNGDFGTAIEYGVKDFSKSLPSSLTYLTPVTAALTSGSMVGQEIDQAKDEKGIATSADVFAGMFKAGLELATERMFGAGRASRELVSRLGKTQAEKAVMDGTKEVIEKTLRQKLGRMYSEEIIGEMTNQIGSNAVDKYIHGKNVSLTDGVGNAGWIALFGAGTQGSLAETATHYIDKKATAKTEELKTQASNLMDEALHQDNPTAAEAIEKHADKLHEEAKVIEDKYQEIIDKATPETLNAIQEVNAKIEDLTASITNVSDEAKPILEQQIVELENEHKKLIKKAEKEVSESLQATPQEITTEPTSTEGDRNNNANIDVADIERRKNETEAKIKRKDLFSDGGVFANELGGSGVNSVPTNHSERNGIEFVQFSNPNTGIVDVIMTGKSGNDFVGYYRIYENGKATNKWSSKFENQSRNKEDFKTMISGVQEMLPQGHEYTEKTSISTDGLRVWNQQLSRGYELQYDNKGNLITNRVAINGDAINNELGIAVNKGNFENISVTNNTDMKKVKEALLPYLQKFGLNESNIHFENGTVEIDLPVLKSNKVGSQENINAKVEEVSKKLDALTEKFVKNGKTQKEAENLALQSISEEERQVLRDGYKESLKTKGTPTEDNGVTPISEKTQKRIDELEAQRDKEIENYKVLFTDNPSEEEKAERIAEAKQEIADDYNSQIEAIKQKAAEREAKRVEAISVEEQQAIDEAIPNLTEPLKKEIKGLTTIENLMSEGVLEYVDEQTGEPCMKHGIRGNSFKRGSEWEIVKDLKGYKTHEQGGVDLTIGSDGIKIKNGKTDYYAKNGLLMPNN